MWVGCPFAAGVMTGAIWPRGWPRGYLLGFGALVGFGVVLYAYFSAPRHYDPFGCSDCREHLGRWWEPDFVVLLVAIGFLAWCSGLYVGSGLRAVAERVARVR